MVNENKVLKVTLLISVIVHGSAILLPNIKFIASQDKFKNSELTYIKVKPKEEVTLKKQVVSRDITPKAKPGSRENNLKQVPKWYELSKSTTAIRPQSSPGARDNILKKPELNKPDVIAVKKKIALTPMGSNKINSPSYISYYQIVREKIRHAAYQNYTSQDTGEVYLSFVVSSNGTLRKAKIMEDKSTPNPYLKEIAFRSLKSASEFPPFPKDLDYPELSFNVIISFEID